MGISILKIFIFFIAFIILLYTISSILKEYLRIKMYSIDMYLDISFEEVDSMVDSFIHSIFNSYIILEGYAINTEIITQSEEDSINKDIGTLIGERMSKNMFDKLGLFYSKESIPDILSEKIGMIVMNYRINHNEDVKLMVNQDREQKKYIIE
mgnify:CR=1 FL=1